LSRIVYLGFPTGEIAGGQKMALRHVEALRDLGFEAVFWRLGDNIMPTWIAHRAPVEVGTKFRPDDVLVVPGDAPNALAHVAKLTAQPAVIFCQSWISLGAVGLAPMAAWPQDRPLTVLTVGRSLLDTVTRAFPRAQVELTPCFADERLFAPGGEAAMRIVAVPRKRPLERAAIGAFFRHLHPRHADLAWQDVDKAPEAELAAAFAGAALHLALPRFESVGLTTLEAMASGCVCAGFTGIGGREYATADNGFWVGEDDCEAAADALAQAADLVRTGGPGLARMREAGFETARQWSYARFVTALEEVWMRLAPQARRRAAALD
jgi:glycosyltransferase involved in cell wall biosynthesis